MCNWQSGRVTGFISRSLFESCVDQLSEMGVDSLCLNGYGESLVHPDFKSFLEYAVQKRTMEKLAGLVGALMACFLIKALPTWLYRLR